MKQNENIKASSKRAGIKKIKLQRKPLSRAQRAKEIIKQEKEIKRPLTKAEWSEISHKISLPKDARKQIDWFIKQFRRAKSQSGQSAAELRTQFVRLHEATEHLYLFFRDIDNPDVWGLLYDTILQNGNEFRAMLKDREAIHIHRSHNPKWRYKMGNGVIPLDLKLPRLLV